MPINYLNTYSYITHNINDQHFVCFYFLIPTLKSSLILYCTHVYIISIWFIPKIEFLVLSPFTIKTLNGIVFYFTFGFITERLKILLSPTVLASLFYIYFDSFEWNYFI